MVDFHKLIDRIQANTVGEKIEIAAGVFGCSPRTVRRLYDGVRPKNIRVYEKLSKLLVDMMSK